jgi:hypothetical protein
VHIYTFSAPARSSSASSFSISQVLFVCFEVFVLTALDSNNFPRRYLKVMILTKLVVNKEQMRKKMQMRMRMRMKERYLLKWYCLEINGIVVLGFVFCAQLLLVFLQFLLKPKVAVVFPMMMVECLMGW